ncbi:helix-turn-helix domain-containing protein [Cohnella nanjingensis]|uniref:Helix-turn-helix transcriptional regulator n=1 Tax=Cohnella nanjingensis TaxID=1387779 RepID=A0A7X0RNU7_9BACL|nr:AraC family transcriptional regulator [Cohnella nanjingensis]MBB6670708.1 helix-turn-helix transcriptional regulator [Cohnella nanjingensis]
MQQSGEAYAVSHPVLASDSLGWDRIRMSQWYSPQQAFVTSGSEASKHLVCIHCTSYYENYYTIHVIPSHEAVLCPWERASLYFLKIEIEPALADELACASGGGPVRLTRQYHVRDPKLLQLGLWMFEELRGGGAKGTVYAESLVRMLVLHLLHHYAAPGEGDAGGATGAGSREIDQSIQYMRANLERDISLVELAGAANLSLSHFIRLFKQQTGYPPHHFLIRLRIERSKLLIRSGQAGLKEIAVQIGFADQGHFTRSFKRITGLTPMQYASGISGDRRSGTR